MSSSSSPRMSLFCLLVLAGCQARQVATSNTPAQQPQPAAVSIANPFPKLLSQVGVFEDSPATKPAGAFVAYDINVPFWSDGAHKRRWVALPPGEHVRFAVNGDWPFPPGTVFLKHFELNDTSGSRASAPKRVETRVLVCETGGNVRGASYRWRADSSDAELVTQPTTAPLASVPGRVWYFPGPQDCRTCHTPATGGVLGVKTRQLNRALTAGGENQLVSWQHAGRFQADLAPLQPDQLPRLASSRDTSRTLTDRARSYLDANCSNCHRPGGVAGNFDARYDTPFERQNLVDGPVLIDLGFDHARTIAPGDVWRSIILARVETYDQTRMPPIGHLTVDRAGAALLRQWIASIPAKPVLPPPTIEPKGGEFAKQVTVTLRHPDPAVTVRYTIDGSRPIASSPAYTKPIQVTEPVTLRASAFKEGCTRSITVQETFVVSP